MKNWKTILSAAFVGLTAAGCSSAYYASSGYADDLYVAHDRTAIARRQQAEAELERAQAEARKAKAEAEQARFEAMIAEAEAAGVKVEYGNANTASSGGSYGNILVDDYRSAYARRLRGFRSPSYRMPSSYYNLRYSGAFQYATAYDPAFYNIIVMGDEVWVEPKYITSMFGSWGDGYRAGYIAGAWSSRWYRPGWIYASLGFYDPWHYGNPWWPHYGHWWDYPYWGHPHWGYPGHPHWGWGGGGIHHHYRPNYYTRPGDRPSYGGRGPGGSYGGRGSVPGHRGDAGYGNRGGYGTGTTVNRGQGTTVRGGNPSGTRGNSGVDRGGSNRNNSSNSYNSNNSNSFNRGSSERSSSRSSGYSSGGGSRGSSGGGNYSSGGGRNRIGR